MIRAILAHAIVYLSLLAAASLASGGPSPSIITAPEVKQLMENGDALLVHVLSRLEYQFQHIPSSINIPIDKVRESKKLPANKNTPIVFYCMGHR
jgi:rhodanese-related sulfurtransferase